MPSYSFKNVAVTLDGQNVLGVWDGDDAVTVAPLEDAGSLLVGADGASIFSQSANEGATITLRLMHTSPSHRLLLTKWKRQRAKGIRVTGFPVSIIDVDSNEGGSCSEAFIQTPATDAKGKNATVREWVLVTGNWNPEVTRVGA